MINKTWKIFVLMPFSPEFTGLYEEGIKKGAEAANAVAERVDEQKYDGTIMTRVVGQIESADLIMAILVGNRPNVMYEVGLAHGLQKRVVLITDDPNKIAFDLKDFPYVIYTGNNAELAHSIADKINWCRANPNARDSFCMAYREGLKHVESVDNRLFSFLVPLAQRMFSDWITNTRELVGAGIPTKGPDRLAITEHIISITRVFRIIDQFVADPNDVHSKDWMQFYNRIGEQKDIEKTWYLCLDLSEVQRLAVKVRASHQFYSSRGFRTCYCQPSDLTESLGISLPSRTIENYGEFVKMLTLGGDGSSYKKCTVPNELLTTIRTCNTSDNQIYECVNSCAEAMDEEWLQKYC